MSEKLHHNHEHRQAHEHVDIAKEVKENLERIESSAEESKEHTHTHTTEQLQSNAEQEAISAKEYTASKPESTDQVHSFAAHAQLKQDAYKKLLKNTQSQLSKPERIFSTFVHRQNVEKISEVASKTVARPIGITFGALATFIGVSVALTFANRYGFSFNHLLFLFLFIGGYIAATAVELLMKLLHKKKA